MESPKSAEALIEDVHSRLDQALERIDRQEYVALAELLPEVEALCGTVMRLPVEQAMAHRDAIEEMVARLDEVKQLMERHRDQVGEQVRSLGGGKAAASAYRKSSHLPKGE